MSVDSSYAKTAPTAIELAHAAKQIIFDENGKKLEFGSLWNDESNGQKIILLFIRHFYCGLCQDFLVFLSNYVKGKDLSNVKIYVIGNGDAALIKPYVKLLKLPFSVFTDPTKKAFNSLGINLRTLTQGKGTSEYVIRSMLSNVLMSIRAAFKMGNILTASSGDISQLGGEFVFEKTEEGIKVLYTNRMVVTDGHGPVKEFLGAAGVIV